MTFTGHGKPVSGVTVSPDGSLLATASGDLTVRLWDAATGEGLRSLRGHTAWVDAVAFSPDGTLLASAGQGGDDVRIWGLASGNGVARVIQPPGPRAAPVPLSPSAITAANVAQLERRALPTSSPYSRVLEFSPDGKQLVTVENTVSLWTMPAGVGRSTDAVERYGLERGILA